MENMEIHPTLPPMPKIDDKAINGVHLSSGHWLILDKIKQLAKKHTYCFASNSFLAKLVHLSVSRVAHCITDLCRAGMLMRQLYYDDEKPKWILRRDLVPVPETVYANLGQESPEQAERIGELMEALQGYREKMEQDRKTVEQRRRVYFKAGQNGISKYHVAKLLHHPDHPEWTLDYIEEKLGILTASPSVQNPIKFLRAAMNGDWKPNRRARRAIAKPTAPAKVTPATAGVSYDPQPVTREYVPEQKATPEALAKKWLKPGSRAYAAVLGHSE